MKLFPLHLPLAARVSVPGSKSHTNRALMLSALAEGSTTLENALFSEDSRYFASALTQLGFEIRLDPVAKTIQVEGLEGRIPATQANLFIGNAGTAARFLTAMLTLGQGRYRLDGIERMRQRPIGDLVMALNDLGAQVEATRQSISGDCPPFLCPPVTINASGLPGGTTSIHGDISSQFLSGLLMVSPYAQNRVAISVEGPLHSKPYIDLTISVMSDFGVEVQREGYKRFWISPQHYHAPGTHLIESDATAASYFFAAPAVCGGWIEVAHLPRSARQGDMAFLDVLAHMGCTVTAADNAVRVAGTQRLRGVDVDMSDFSDTFMTLAAIAPFAETPTRVRGIASSRLKETDRIVAVVNELRRLGVNVIEHPDGLTIHPCENIQSTRIHTYDDHRIAMAFALIGLRVPDLEIENPQCVAKTFPDYFEILENLCVDPGDDGSGAHWYEA